MDISGYQGDLKIFTAINATVKIYDIANGVDLVTTLQTDENGWLAPTELPVEPGTRLRFRVENYQGFAGSYLVVTY